MCSKESALAELGRLLEVQVRGKEIRSLQENLVECRTLGVPNGQSSLSLLGAASVDGR